MTDATFNRRGFLTLSGSAIAGTLLYAAGPIALIAPSRSWAMELQQLDAHTGATLLRFTRHLYPHDTLEDVVYALVVKDLDQKALGDAASRATLVEGVAGLDAEADGSWLDAPATRQAELVLARESTPFFQLVRSTAVVALYNNELAFAHFGYEGPAFEKGGYIGRGFDDIDWLPDPPAEASPAVAG